MKWREDGRFIGKVHLLFPVLNILLEFEVLRPFICPATDTAEPTAHDERTRDDDPPRKIFTGDPCRDTVFYGEGDMPLNTESAAEVPKTGCLFNVWNDEGKK